MLFVLGVIAALISLAIGALTAFANGMSSNPGAKASYSVFLVGIVATALLFAGHYFGW